MSSLLSNKHILVTGAGGFIGSHLVEALAAQGAQVRAFVRYNSRGDPGLLRLLPPQVFSGLEVVAGDLRDPQAVRSAVSGCQVVLHLGALISIPYSYFHPVEVATILLNELPLDDVSVAAALLHDVIEDSGYTFEDIVAELGVEVAEIVEGLTKISGITINRETTQAEGFRKMLLSMVNDIRVMLVKFADRLHNVRTIEYLPLEKQQRMARETKSPSLFLKARRS